jgi:hypothetical protein
MQNLFNSKQIPALFSFAEINENSPPKNYSLDIKTSPKG